MNIVFAEARGASVQEDSLLCLQQGADPGRLCEPPAAENQDVL
jgi:hypothetical protein